MAAFSTALGSVFYFRVGMALNSVSHLSLITPLEIAISENLTL